MKLHLTACFLLTCIVLSLVGCASSRNVSNHPPVRLSAAMIDRDNVGLTWDAGPTNAAGYVVEWTASREDPFVMIAVTGPAEAAFKHSDVMPGVNYFYQVRPFFGPASEVVKIAISSAESVVATNTAAPSTTATARYSVRDLATMAKAAPADVRIRLISPLRARIEWQDRASDEESYFIEGRMEGDSEFHVLELRDANETACETLELDANTRWDFRVRPFVYGRPSPIITVKTEPRSEQAVGAPVSDPARR